MIYNNVSKPAIHFNAANRNYNTKMSKSRIYFTYKIKPELEQPVTKPNFYHILHLHTPSLILNVSIVP